MKVMPSYDKHTLESLEFPRIRLEVAKHCLSEGGCRLCEALQPADDSLTIENSLAETEEMREICEFEEPIPLERQEKIGELIEKLAVVGSILDPEQLRRLSAFQKMVVALSQYRVNKGDKYPRIDTYLRQLTPLNDLILRIDKAIDNANEIRDQASDHLRRLRTEKATARAQILDRLNRILASKGHRAGHQDDIITIRDGRYVITIVDSDFDPRTAVVHDRSRTGATLYVEPTEAIELNNRLKRLLIDEQREIERILLELSDYGRNSLSALARNVELYYRVDFLHAKARFALDIDAVMPQLSGKPVVSLQAAFHPLLLLTAKRRANVVPLSLELGYDHDIVIITGPNTGGKTVALKTAGLLTLMVQSGLLVSADAKSEFGIFEKVFADIGDEQSIELSLSTYSAHIARVTSALGDCNERSLLLFDELGVGTDPKEGAALAEAIIEYVDTRGARCIVTTHYSALKALAESHPRIINASLEFNRETLQPTYKFRTGLPGSSYAIEVASRLGMPENVLKRAAELVGSQERSLAELIARLEQELRAADVERKRLQESLSRANELQQLHQAQLEKVKRREQELLKEGYEEAQRLLEQTRRQVEQMMNELRQAQPAKGDLKKARKSLEELRRELEQTQAVERKEAAEGEPPQVGDRVFVEKFQAEGELAELFPDGKRAKVRIGKVLYTMELAGLRRISAEEVSPELPEGVNYQPYREELEMEISIRGMTAEEAREALDQYFDRIALSHLPYVRIVHGKGTGVLRRMVREYLSKNKLVESFELGDWNEGSWGVTIVKLKD